MTLSLSRRAALAGLVAAPAFGASVAVPTPVPFTLKASGDRTVDAWRWQARGRRQGRILFSHGNFSAPLKYARLLGAWAAHGWEVLAPLHVDSTDHPEKAKYSPMQSWPTRLEDLALLAELDGKRPYIAAGHSYGALLALVLGGVTPLLPGARRDPRVRAAIALSPPGPMEPFIDAKGYATLAIPALIQTGDKDIFPGMPPESWRAHLAAFEQPPANGTRLGIALPGVDHYFGGILGRPELPGPRPEAQYAGFERLSLTYLRAFAGGRRANAKEIGRLAKAESALSVLYR